MKKGLKQLVRRNLALSKKKWPKELGKVGSQVLRSLTEHHSFEIAFGDLILLEGKWYVTHAGLLRYAHRHRCSGIKTTLDRRLSDPAANRWVFRAIVYRPGKLKAFFGYGDADPFNVSPAVRGAEMRVAETRAVNRALRKAYGIGICSVEELGTLSSTSKPTVNLSSPNRNGSHPQNGSEHFQPSLRDQLCLLIRQFSLDATQVRAYATRFCKTNVLSEASRESVESFISHLSAAARENRDALVCKLNSYAKPVEVKL